MAIGFQGKFALLLSDRSEFIKINRDGGKRYRLDTTDEVESWNDSFFVDVVRSWPDGRREVVLFSFDTDRSQTLVVVRDAEGRFHGMGTDERPTFLLVPIVGTWSKARGYERPWEGRGRFWLKWAADDTWVVRKGDYFVSQGGDERPDAMQVVRVGMALPGIGVGELEDGEVALYAEPHYGGRAWVLNADTPDFRRLPGMKDAVRSVRVGPRAAVSLFDQPAWSGKFQLEVDEDMPALPAGIDHNALSAKVWLNPGVQALPKVGEIAVYAQPGFIGSGRILPALPTGLFDATILFRAVGFGSVQLGPGMALSLIGSGPRHVVYSSIEDVNDGLPFPVASTEQLNIFFQSQSPRFEGPWALRTTTAAHARYLSSAGEVPRGRATAGAAEALRLRPGTSGPPSEVSILAPDGRVLHWRGPANLELVFQATPNVFPIFDLHVEGPGRWAIGLDRPGAAAVDHLRSRRRPLLAHHRPAQAGGLRARRVGRRPERRAAAAGDGDALRAPELLGAGLGPRRRRRSAIDRGLPREARLGPPGRQHRARPCSPPAIRRRSRARCSALSPGSRAARWTDRSVRSASSPSPIRSTCPSSSTARRWRSTSRRRAPRPA